MSRQKIIILPINSETESAISAYLAQGYVLHQITALESLNKLLIVYYDPASDPLNE